jgi:putative tricarboxylic transport membrane protein
MSGAAGDTGGKGPSHRLVEIGVAAFTGVMAAVTIVGSLRVGFGWGLEGPRAGFFPFYVGLALAAASLFNLAAAILIDRRTIFAEWPQLRHVLSVFVPTAIYVALIPFLGIYVSSALLIGAFMKWLGHYSWLITLLVAIGVPLVIFFLFEDWFLVSLPKGPVEALLGY